MSTGPEHGQVALPADHPARSLGWRIRHSLWLLIPALGLSWLGGIGFLYVGIRARRPAWWISGICYLVLGWTSFVVVGVTPQQSVVSTIAVWVYLVSYLASLIHAAAINGAWLRWRATWVPWYAQPAVAPPPSHPGPAYPGPAHHGSPHSAPTGYVSNPYGPGTLPPGLVPPPESFYGPGPSAAPVTSPARPGPAPTAPSGAAATVGPPSTVAPGPPTGTAGEPAVDVNTAGYEQLVALPGFHPDRAARVLAQRQAQRGFGSVQEFAAVAGLAPHEFARLRHRLVCAPPRAGQAAGSAFGPAAGDTTGPTFGSGTGPTGGAGRGSDDDGWRPPHQGRVLDV
ncbi:helix-hairpin-helix domain-containing protein [Micromonospora sp. HM5-17]|uniref:helix-hairpin-helix domain-containing protein n=1 Tax=Micromonospora sp. HM5-17 TaxID=2487710 RepID=UPI000F4842B0|nr:helix-hairpin-helix domain-containing protein [Micromonospora sp. HM5-17]ROT32162.1 hypothetical protein EF879_11175 [Micromonospora sp. HM5-17]